MTKNSCRFALFFWISTVCCEGWGHHSFAAEFDVNRPIEIVGKVTKVQWINPHAWIHVKTEGGLGEEVWMIEGGTPNTLFRRGINRDTVPIGIKVIVRGYQAKSGETIANGRELMLPDGRKLLFGASGGVASGQD
jgi:hypothetical protein